MSATTADTQVLIYLDGVRAHLDDLPEEDRNELLEDLEEHLREVAAEGEGTLQERLGSPAFYAEELRASAGLPSRDQLAARGSARSFAETLSSSAVVRRVTAFLESDRYRSLSNFIEEYRPGWWVLRGYLAVVAAGVIASDRLRDNVPYPYLFGSHAVGVGIAIAGIAVSVWLGRRAQRQRRGRVLSVALTLAVIVAGAWLLSRWTPTAYAAYEVTPGGSYLQHADGTPITNICPYSAEGKPLAGVLLFDQQGRPILNAAPAGWDGGLVQPSGPAIPNAYPLALSVQDPATGQLQPLLCPASVGPSQAGPPPVSPSPAGLPPTPIPTR